MAETIELGDEVRDQVSTFTGIVVCVAQWLHGCRRITVQPQDLKDGKPIDPYTFDELQLKLVKKGVVKSTPASVPAPAPLPARTGGPRPDPTR